MAGKVVFKVKPHTGNPLEATAEMFRDSPNGKWIDFLDASKNVVRRLLAANVHSIERVVKE